MPSELPVINANDPIEGEYKDFIITIVKEEHHEEIMKHLRKNLLRDEPIAKCLGGTEEYNNAFCRYLMDALRQNNGQSLVALDKKTGNIAGVRLSKVATKESEQKDKENRANNTEMLPVFKKVCKMMFEDLYQPLSPTVFDMFGVNKVIDYRVLSVADEYRQMGLAYEMLLRSMRLAKKEGIRLFRGIYSSLYSRRAVEKLGFKVYNEIFYDEYKIDGEIFLKDMGPHKSIVVAIKEL